MKRASDKKETMESSQTEPWNCGPNFLNTTVHISVNLYYVNVIESKEQRNLFHELLLNVNFLEFPSLLLETTDHLTIQIKILSLFPLPPPRLWGRKIKT